MGVRITLKSHEPVFRLEVAGENFNHLWRAVGVRRVRKKRQQGSLLRSQRDLRRHIAFGVNLAGRVVNRHLVGAVFVLLQILFRVAGEDDHLVGFSVNRALRMKAMALFSLSHNHVALRNRRLFWRRGRG